jgi:hypothetical protein
MDPYQQQQGQWDQAAQPWNPNEQPQWGAQGAWDQSGGTWDPNEQGQMGYGADQGEIGPGHHNYKQEVYTMDAQGNRRVNLDADEEDLVELDMFKIDIKDMKKYRGVTGWWVLVTGILMIVLNITALATPTWRHNSGGVLGYGSARSWGLFTVSGKTSTYHHDMYSDTCIRMNQYTFLGGCSSPICIWYQTKCVAYRQLMYVSYCCGAVMILATIVFAHCTWWSIKFTPRSLRWASGWWPVGLLLHGIGVGCYTVMTDQVFDQLNTESYYPSPYYSVGFFTSCMVGMFAFINMTLACQLHSQWSGNEMVKDEEATTSEEGSDDDERVRVMDNNNQAYEQY